MTRVVIMHGGYDKADCLNPDLPSPSNRHWFPWVQQQLLVAGFDAQTPEVLHSYLWNYATWVTEMDRHVATEPMVLVGHSTGAAFLLRWLTERPTVRVTKLVLVAPYLDPFRVHGEDGFFAFDLDPQLRRQVDQLYVFHSTDDSADIIESVDQLLHTYPWARIRQFADRGHFTLSSMGTAAFVELVDVITDSGPS